MLQNEATASRKERLTTLLLAHVQTPLLQSSEEGERLKFLSCFFQVLCVGWKVHAGVEQNVKFN